MTPEHRQELDALFNFIGTYERTGRTPRQFWAEFDAKAAWVEAEAAQAGDGSQLAEYFLEVRDFAHEAFGGPPESLDDVME